MGEVVAASPGFPERRLLRGAFSGFALLAVLLSAIGLFGIAAHDVASRRAGLALRLAVREPIPGSFCALRWHAESSWLQPV